MSVVADVWSSLRLKFPSWAGLWLSGPYEYNGDRGEKKKNEKIIDTNTHPDLMRYLCRVLRLERVPCFLVVLGNGSKDFPSLVLSPGSSLEIAEATVRFSFLGLSVNIFEMCLYFQFTAATLAKWYLFLMFKFWMMTVINRNVFSFSTLQTW